MADSERVIWTLAGKYRGAVAESIAWQQVVAVLACRHAGVLVIEPAELTRLPSSLTLVTSIRDDGRIVICAVESDEPAEPGRPG